MADILTAVATFLLAQTSITALTSTRIVPAPLPLGKPLPAITFQMVSDVHELLHDGPQGLPVARIQFNCWGESYKDAHAVANVLRPALDGATGTWSGINIGYAQVTNLIDDVDAPTGKNRVIVDVSIQRSE